MSTTLQLPFYARFALISIGAFAFVSALYMGQGIILPILYAFIFAILLNPLVNFLVRIRINRVLAILIAVVLAIIVVLCFVFFISAQFSLLAETYPALKDKFNNSSVQLIKWISDTFNVSTGKINAWINNTEKELVNNLGSALGQTLSTISSFLVIVILIPVYIFMILFYKNLLIEFIRKLFKADQHEAVFEILGNSKKIIQSYLFGLFLEALIIAFLNSLGLYIIGIQYSMILGITGALLNVIPYIGGVIAIALPMIIAFVTKDSTTYPLLVLVVYLLIQFIDNHFIIPSIVASKVKINALISIIVVLVGGALWGIAGMFLSIPLTAIIKVIFDHIESLKPWGFLLGNTVTTQKPKINFIKKKISKST